MTMNATSTEKATEISTTSGMPLAPVAARMRPFSRLMKPMIWLMAFCRVTIISRPSRMTDSASARSSRAIGSASAAAGSITTIDKATSIMPISMVRPMPPTVSMVRCTPSRSTMRCSASGISAALRIRASAAVT